VVAEGIFHFTDPVILADGSVHVLTDRDYPPKVLDLLSRAQDSIHIVMFSANYQTDPKYIDANVNKLLNQLVSARNRGVDVKVIMDDWPEGNDKTANYLEKNNIEVTIIDSDGSMHAKLIIIDGEIIVVGSTNWSYHSVDKNNEANVIIKNKRVAEEFEGYFLSLASAG
jgi:phosphatidylserine/phosphatidylglycerophosphate/cardiolipin synthase-like enzyme